MKYLSSTKFIYMLCVIAGIICGYAFMSYYRNCSSEPSERFYIASPEELSIARYGNIKVYNKIRDSIRKYNPECPDYIQIAYKLANTYNYTPANYDIYLGLKEMFELNGIDMDMRTDSMAKFFLMRGAERGDKRAIEELTKLKIIKEQDI